ncbi:universal stress protein [Sphaerimonospora thailandensis]|uniref:Universal stress protein n=1 Tax=Sphaerimonospora thailandensis TaxID=795644 RepID=A0A8J3R5Z8_9ACTN|nr:universal stress protein [Sphaerimonospora thailandensis]GIH68466.1 universal stress protein [Sphaerimonospora thailandensis]
MIVVGIDGSQAGLEATAWAAGEAVLRGVPLRVVHAIPRWVLESGESDEGGRYAGVARWMREGADTALAAAVDRARRASPEVEVDSAHLPGDPRSALIEAAAKADLLVVGDHGLGGFRGLLLGSVAYGVAGQAPCDVVIVRDVPVPPRGEVVVGVDGSPIGAAALDFAFAEAALRGARLRAVHAWTWFEAGGGFVPMPDDLDVERGETRLLNEALAGRRGRYPDVEVVEEVVRGHPVEVLGQASDGADLLVVGSRGRGNLAGLLLGSVSQAVLQHARCPLVVVRGR